MLKARRIKSRKKTEQPHHNKRTDEHAPGSSQSTLTWFWPLFSIISHYNKRWPRLLLVYFLAEEDTFEVKKHIQRMASATCASPAVRLVYVRQQHEAAANVRYLPACTWVSRCSDEIGCCADDSKICSASHVETVSLPFFVSPSSSSCGLVRHNSRRRRRSPKKANRDRDKNPFFSPCPVLSSAAPGTRSDPDRSPLYSSFPFLFVLLVFHQSHSWQILELPKVNAGLRSPFFSFYCSDSLPVSPSRLGLVIYPTTVIVGADRDGNGDQEDGDETDFRESHGLRMRRTEQRLDAQDGAWTARVRAPSIISESNESPGWGRREEKNDRAASSSPAEWKVVVARRRKTRRPLWRKKTPTQDLQLHQVRHYMYIYIYNNIHPSVTGSFHPSLSFAVLNARGSPNPYFLFMLLWLLSIKYSHFLFTCNSEKVPLSVRLHVQSKWVVRLPVRRKRLEKAAEMQSTETRPGNLFTTRHEKV